MPGAGQPFHGVAGRSTGCPRESNTEISKAVDAPALKARFAESSFVPAKSDPEQFKDLLREDLKKIGKASKEADIKIDF